MSGRRDSLSPVAGSRVETDLTHRRMIGPTPGLRPFKDSNLFDRIGGRVTIDRLVDSLYDRFEADRVIRPLFGRDLSDQRKRQKLFFAEWIGGPPRYSNSAWGTLHGHHEDLPITQAIADRWLSHLRGALRDTIPDQSDAAVIIARAQAVALAFVNHEDVASSLGQEPRTLRHRSQRIASCGVGARTLKQAVLAAQHGRMDELAALVVEVPEVVQRPAFAANLLQSATLAGRVEMVEWLIDRGVDVNTPAPLHVGTIGASFELVFFVTPLCAARMRGRSELNTYLLSRGACEDIFTAAFLGDVPLVRELLTEQPSLAQVADPATDVLTITPIHHAVGGGQLPTLRVLLEHTTEPVRTGARALRAAAARGDRVMVELLLEHGADAYAVGAGRWVLDPEIAPLLKASGASAGLGVSGEESGEWVKISCTGNQGRKDDPTYVAALLGHGARVHQRYNGATPLHYVVKAGFTETIRVLLAHGADRYALDDRDRTPLDWLAQAAKSVDRAAVRHALQNRPSSPLSGGGPLTT